MVALNPEFKDVLVPLCEYRGGICTEFYPCGRNKKYIKGGANNIEVNDDKV